MPSSTGPARRDCRLVWNRDDPDLETVGRAVTGSFELHDFSSPGTIRGPAGYRRYVAAVRSALPDLTARVETALRTGETVFYRRVLVGTHREQFLGVPGSGRTVRLRLSTLARVEGDRIAAAWTPGWRSISAALAAASDRRLLPDATEDPGWEGVEVGPDGPRRTD